MRFATTHAFRDYPCASRNFYGVEATPYLRVEEPSHIILPSTGTNSSATMLMILINGLIAGPAVSL
jgi:hypothetical protein